MHPLIQLALAEDLGPADGPGDATSNSLIEETVMGRAVMEARHPGVMAGGDMACQVFKAVNPAIECEPLLADGTPFEKGALLLRARGPVRSLLTAERTALNFIQRSVGIASYARQYAEIVEPFDCVVLDTRKTLPGYRELDKHAVKCGGCTNHRMGLYDRVMIKDNHVLHWTQEYGLPDAVRQARKAHPDLVIESEADTVDQVKQLLEAKPDWILLDNMTLDQLRECVALCNGKCKTEASGGVTLTTLHDIAATGVDAISVGALTHSVKAHDISLDLEIES